MVRDWEIEGTAQVVTARGAAERFIEDREALKLSDAMLRKYRHLTAEISQRFGDMPLGAITTDDIRKMREGWKLASVTTQKRLEMVRKFFKFCVDSDWIEKNPAKAVETPAVNYAPTMPFTDEQMEKILWAAENIRVAHPKIPEDTPKKLLALILLMRYSGERVVDEKLCGSIGKLMLSPAFYLLLHGGEVALHPVYADRKCILEVEVFGVLGEHGSKLPVERHVVANEYSVTDRKRQSHGLIVRVADADCESCAVESGFKFENAEKLHPIFRNGIFIANHVDMPIRQTF